MRSLLLAGLSALCLVAGSLPALAGTLSGPILDDGTTAILEDWVQIPASDGSNLPRARINVLQEAPDGTGRVFVNDLRGWLYVIDGGLLTTFMEFKAEVNNFRDSPGLASGFVSFAFHPDFASNGHFYTVHSEHVGATAPNLFPAVPTTVEQHSVLTEWTAFLPSSNTWAGTSRELIRIASPNRFHNMGEIVFDPTLGPGDPDYGLLYIGAGDFGSVANAEPEQLQRRDTPLGAVLRIDPLGGPFLRGGTTFDYGIPASNPFASDPDPDVLGEIYAYGFRNAHRIAWDVGATDSGPWVSDIGEKNIEEINRLVAGENYGWPEREGTFAIDVDSDPDVVFALPGNDASFGYRYPAAQYDHDEGRANAGGFVYRGPIGPLREKFVFGDIVDGRILYSDVGDLAAADDGDPATTAAVYELSIEYAGQSTQLIDIVADALGLGSINRADLRFGRDQAGQIYVMTKQDGWIRKLIPVPEPHPVFALATGLLALMGLARRR